jgi:hypothetical protein
MGSVEASGTKALNNPPRHFALIKTTLLPSAVSMCYSNCTDLIKRPPCDMSEYFNNFAACVYVCLSKSCC